MTPEREMEAARLAVALAELEHTTCLRLTGEDAFDALDVICPADLYLRDGQMLHTLLLDDRAYPLADVYVCRDDEDFLLLTEGLDAAALAEHVQAHLPTGVSPGLEELTPSHRLLSLNGPWAWELMAELVGPGVVGLPYLSFYHEEGWTCFRSGKTGEFGYDLLVAGERYEELKGALMELGEPWDIAWIGTETLDQCALENGFFNIRREGRAGVTPLELQLQWRVSYGKEYVGAEALKQRRAAGAKERLTCLVGPEPIAVGDEVRLDDEGVGRVVNAGRSSTRGDWVASALLRRDCAHVGLDVLTVAGETGVHGVRTMSPPVIDNRSLFLSQQKHSYRTRDQHTFPPLHGGTP